MLAVYIFAVDAWIQTDRSSIFLFFALNRFNEMRYTENVTKGESKNVRYHFDNVPSNACACMHNVHDKFAQGLFE